MSQESLHQLEASVRARIADDAGVGAGMRAWSRAARVALLGLAQLVVAAFAWTFLRRVDADTYPEARLLVLGGGYAVLALVAAWHALRPLWLPPLPRAMLVATFAAGLLLPVLAAFLPELPTLPRFQPDLHRHVAWTFHCWAAGGAAGGAVLLLARLVDRGSQRHHDAALLAALAASLVGLVTLQLECPLNFTVHLLVAHATLPLGFLALARLLWRARD